MRAHLRKIWLDAWASYWLVPSLMAIGALVLSFITLRLDVAIGFDWPENVAFVYSNQPDGARALLSTVAGSMITVTGITFSLTLLAVSHATSQFGPRLLTNFMRDRGNQITLGTFIATFLYCLMILRTVQGAEEPSGAKPATASEELMSAFVPHLSITVSILLTLASVAVLIYFIHHIPESIRLSNVVANIGRELLDSIDDLFPESIAEDQPDSQNVKPELKVPDRFDELSRPILSRQNGYIQTADDIGILNLAMNHDLIIKMESRPGDFLSSGQELMRVFPSNSVTEQIEDDLHFMFTRGAYRTSRQNALFLVDQLVEVIARALSPGVNDPMTAITCIDWLQTGLFQLTDRVNPEQHRFDRNGELRFLGNPTTFNDFAECIFDQLRPYLASDRNAAIHMVKMMRNVANHSGDERHRENLKGRADDLIQASQSAGMFPGDVSKLKDLADEIDVGVQ